MSEVKPRAWLDCWGDPFTSDEGLGDSKTPLYDQSALDAAVAAERERCAKLCDQLEASIWLQYKSETTSNQHTEGRSDGAAECAALIRGK